MPFDPPIDHAELCARVRFRLDEPTDLPADELRERERYAADRTARLQAGGVRVTPTLTPGLHAKLEDARTRLLLPDAPALYVHSDGEVNATATYGGPRCVLTATSALVNLLTLDEFGAILGHEIGHIGMRHAHRDNEGGLARVFMLERSRAAEVSCDRLSIIAAGNPRTAISAMLKVVSGLSADHLTLDVDAFMAQLAERPHEVDLEWEALETHPVLPFRIWALRRFSQTDICRSLLGLEGGDPAEAVENEICERFRAIGGSLTGRAVTDHLHEALVWTAALIIDEDESHSDIEMSVLASVAGSVWAEDVIRYLRTHGPRAVETRAKDSLRALSGAGSPVRQRVQSHLDILIERLGAQVSRARVEALLRDAWGDAKR
jgi:hypothetical protein